MNEDKRTRTQRYSDNIAEFCGSWGFVIWFSVGIAIWVALNTFMIIFHKFDEYPFILLNLFLTIVSTMQSPVIMMSQNRQVERDRDHIKGLHAKLDTLIVSDTEIELLRNAVLSAEGIRFDEETRFVVPETMDSWFRADRALWEFKGKCWTDRGDDNK